VCLAGWVCFGEKGGGLPESVQVMEEGHGVAGQMTVLAGAHRSMQACNHRSQELMFLSTAYITLAA